MLSSLQNRYKYRQRPESQATEKRRISTRNEVYDGEQERQAAGSILRWRDIEKFAESGRIVVHLREVWSSAQGEEIYLHV